jgi:hypothetical protein
MQFLSEVFFTASTELKLLAGASIVNSWITAPYADEKLDLILVELRFLEPINVTYLTAQARMKVLQGRAPEALAICAAIPSQLHSETTLAIYCELIRLQTCISETDFDILYRYWALTPEHIDNTIFLANQCVSRRDIGRSELIVRRGLEKVPDAARLRYQLAVILKLAGRRQDCIAELQQLLQLPEDDLCRSREDIRLLMIRCLIETELYEAAFRQAQTMIRTRDVLEVLYELGSRFFETGKGDRAKECWEDIYAVDVRFKDVAEKVHGLSSVIR